MSDAFSKIKIPVQSAADGESFAADKEDGREPFGDDSSKDEIIAQQNLLHQHTLGELSERREQLAYLGKLSAAIALGAASVLTRYLPDKQDAGAAEDASEAAVSAWQLSLPEFIPALLVCILFLCFYTTWRGVRFSKHAGCRAWAVNPLPAEMGSG